jgi:hypothetical protein
MGFVKRGSTASLIDMHWTKGIAIDVGLEERTRDWLAKFYQL